MYESEFQKKVSEILIEKEYERLTIDLSANELSIVVKLTDSDAAYTADEARHLANSIHQYATRTWEDVPYSVIVYLHDLADVVEDKKPSQELEDTWRNVGATEEDLDKIFQNNN